MACKPQPTLSGYYEWAFSRLVDARGERQGSVAAHIIKSWIDDNRDYLERTFDIRRADYDDGKKVVALKTNRR